MQFGEYLRNLRKERHLLQREIASMLQMDMALLSKIERGTRKVDEPTKSTTENGFFWFV